MKAFGLITILILITALGLSACAAPKPFQQFTLRMGQVGTLSSLPYYVMLDQGFDKQNGLDITDATYKSSELLLNAIAEGSLDGSSSIGISNVLIDRQNGIIPEKITVVAANSFADPEHPIIGVVVADSVLNWKDLEGQSIGVPSKTSMIACSAIGRLLQEGVTHYTLVEISVSNTGLAIASANIAAGVMAEPYLTQSLLRQDGRLLDWVIGGKPLEKTEYSAIIFSTNIVKNNPEAVKAFLRAHRQACLWIEKNPEATRSALGKYLSLTPEVVRDIRMMRWPPDMHNDPVLLESIQPMLVDIGLLKAPIPAALLYDETLLNQVLAETR